MRGSQLPSPTMRAYWLPPWASSWALSWQPQNAHLATSRTRPRAGGVHAKWSNHQVSKGEPSRIPWISWVIMKRTEVSDLHHCPSKCVRLVETAPEELSLAFNVKNMCAGIKVLDISHSSHSHRQEFHERGISSNCIATPKKCMGIQYTCMCIAHRYNSSKYYSIQIVLHLITLQIYIYPQSKNRLALGSARRVTQAAQAWHEFQHSRDVVLSIMDSLDQLKNISTGNQGDHHQIYPLVN